MDASEASQPVQKHPERKTRDEHLFGLGPKRILSLDGGGVRGIVSLGFLERLEAEGRAARGGDESYRLSDDFDLIGGTSTGAIIATGLALGFSVRKLIGIYLDLSKYAFAKRRWYGGLLVPKFSSKGLQRELERELGERTLGSEALLTGLAIVAKRIDTGSPWVFHNNPRSRYFNPPPDEPTAMANRSMRLVSLLRASAAAPTYFEPESIAVNDGVIGLFVDGGASPYNNPALLLTMMATTRAYGYGWRTGARDLSIVSVGTGAGVPALSRNDLERMPTLKQAMASLSSVMADCSWQAQAVLQWLGQAAMPWKIDSEAGDLAGETPMGQPLFTYRRYDLMLEKDWLRQELDIDIPPDELRRLRQMDRPQSAERLLELARLAAARQIPGC